MRVRGWEFSALEAGLAMLNCTARGIWLPRTCAVPGCRQAAMVAAVIPRDLIRSLGRSREGP